MQNFNELELPQSLAEALKAISFKVPTPIQAKAIPVALSKRDMIGIAQTGTGKTAAFCIPICVRLLRAPGKTALVLVPTRELAKQIDDFWRELTRFTAQMNSIVLIGGTSMQPQTRKLHKNPRLIIATPGRLVDHLSRGTVSLYQTDILVLDEADRMLDMGFAPQLGQILRFLPKIRQTLMFSATWESNTDKLASQYTKDPVRISVEKVAEDMPKIEQALVTTTVAGKNETLLDEINKRPGSILIFARTQSRTDRVARYLNEYGLEVNRIHGGRSQGQRNSALAGFKSGKARILVATDIAARGIDVADISHVINYDLPQMSEDYIHRIGRTGRAGASGQAVSLITPEDRSQWRSIAQLLQKKGIPCQHLSEPPKERRSENVHKKSVRKKNSPDARFERNRKKHGMRVRIRG